MVNKIKQYLFILFYLSIGGQSLAQKQLKKYVQANVKPIQSIQPDYTDDSDLQEISKAIGDARIVMLGEQDHGDGATFLAKTRLIKYLHQQQGFNILAFEGDFFALNEGWDKLVKEKAYLMEFLHANIYRYWSRCQECDELLYAYIPETYQTKHPLRIAGFDNQLYGGFSKDSLKAYLSDYLTKQNIAFARSSTFQEFVLPFLDTLSRPWFFSRTPDTYLIANKHDKLHRFEAAIDTILGQLPNQSPQTYEYLLLQNLKELAKESDYYTENEIATYNIRDAQMAKNLEWLVQDKYPTEKVIVWAANAHISKGPVQAYKYQARPIHWMGWVFTQNAANNRQTYVLGFDSKAGTFKRTTTEKVLPVYPPTKNGFEAWIDAGIPYAFVDFKRFKEQHPGFATFFEMKGVYHASQPAVWTDIYDGIFYIKDMTPCGESHYQPPTPNK